MLAILGVLHLQSVFVNVKHIFIHCDMVDSFPLEVKEHGTDVGTRCEKVLFGVSR